MAHKRKGATAKRERKERIERKANLENNKLTWIGWRGDKGHSCSLCGELASWRIGDKFLCWQCLPADCIEMVAR